MTAAGRRLLALLLAALPAVAHADASDGWRWLAQASPDERGVTWSPGIDDRDRVVVSAVLPATVSLAITAPERMPGDGDVAGSGFVYREDGLVAASWSLLSRVGPDRRLWAKTPGSAWVRAIPLGATWWADAGLARLASLRRTWRALGAADVQPEDLGKRFLAVGTATGRPSVVATGRLTGLSWFDPDAEGGRTESTKHRVRKPGKRAVLVGLRFEESLAAQGGAGSPVLDERGACVGIVADVEAGRSAEERVLVRPTAFAKTVLDAIANDASFDPPDLGIVLAWSPDPQDDLRRARERVKGGPVGGALVTSVLPEGPANGKVWEGDVVLALDGKPVFAEVRESIALATLGLQPKIPAQVTLLRGGKPTLVSVTPERARTLYPNFQRTHDAAAAVR